MNTHTHHAHGHYAYGRAFTIGIAINVAFVAAEIAYGLKAHSLALLADAGHNASDVLGLCMAWGAGMLGRRRPSERFTYGLQSASIYAALANALILLIAVGGIGWQAFERFLSPEIPATGMVMIVASVGVFINGITAWLFHDHHHDLNIRGVFVHMMADAGISLGVVLSGYMISTTGWLWLDPLVSLLIILAIISSSWRLFRESANLALHAVPENIDTAAVRNYLANLPGVKEAHDLHIWAMSTNSVAMSAHLLMPGGHPGDELIHRITHELEEQFHINHVTIQIEIGDAHDHCHTGCGDHAH